MTLREVLLVSIASLFWATVPAAAADPASAGTPHFSLAPDALWAAASVPSAAEGTDATVLEDEESYVFDAGGRSVHSHYIVYKVLTQKGADDWDSLSLGWEPWHEERPVIRARVITPDFTVHELDPKAIADAPAREDSANVYSDRRVLRTPLPAIAPGSVVEEEMTSHETAPLFGAGIVGRSFFGRIGVPVQHTRVVLEGPSSLPLRYEVQLMPDLTPQRTETDGKVRIVFEKARMEGLEYPEADLPGDVPAFPSVAFSTGSSWQQIADEYSKIVDSRINLAEVKAQVDKVIAGKTGRDQRAQAILAYLHQNVRYTGVEFGEAAIVPHAPAETLAHKYGDCKDKATLLAAMLRSAGIPAYVALLNAGNRQDVPAALPGMGLFDHAIIYVPGVRDWWIDATDEYARLGQLPAPDQGRWALIARAGSNALVRTSESSSQENVLLEKREIHLAENGPSRIVETSQPRGIFEAEYRGYYADKSNKEHREGLTNYVKSEYLAEKLDRLDRSDPAEFSKPFELVLESDKARRGFTDLDTAVAVIPFGGIFSRLPDQLRQRDSDEETGEKSKTVRRRTADYQLRAAFVSEWQYEIVPPFGFQSKQLPQDLKISLGPALLTQQFTAEKNGTVRAVLRFDTVKRRFSVAEATEMRNKIAELNSGPAVVINFEPVGQALFRQGKVRESFQTYRNLIAQHPKEAVHHLQMAEALLAAGMGEGARKEAQLAVTLEPNSALAQKTLADILEYDLVGRKLRPGSDYAGAAAALRAAARLDPDDKAIAGNLAILLEYDDLGMRYGSGARLKEAVAEYRRLGPEKLAGLGLQNNLPFALFYAGEFAEARKSAEVLNPPLNPLLVACETAAHGSKAGIAEANKRAHGEAEFKEITRTAGEMLMNNRQ